MVSLARTDYLTPNQIGFFVNSIAGYIDQHLHRHWHHRPALEAILMTEKFSNHAVTTLSAAITTTTATSCTVTDATMFPTSGNFRIKIDG